jgi:hypothetical protein
MVTMDRFFSLPKPYTEFTIQEKELFKWYHVLAIDRTLLLDGHYVIPKYITTKSLKDIILDRAFELSTKPDLYLLWSGGIDSTVVLYALLKYTKNFKVIATPNSRREYKKVFDELQSGTLGPELIVVESIFLYTFPDEANIITGEIGDQLIGSERSLKITYLDRQRHYTEVLEESFIQNTQAAVLRLIGSLELTTSEYLWACNFIFKYINVCERIFPKYSEQNVHHFFDTTEFQSWSITTFRSRCHFTDEYTYKNVLKQFVLDENNDEHYYKYKTKYGSLNNNVVLMEQKNILD